MSQEQAPEAVTNHPTPAVPVGRFTAWRRRRPFWGATLTILSGVVLWFSGLLRFDTFELQFGITGMQATILPVALVLLGALVMLQPQFHLFYGILTIALALYSLLGVNMGGLGIGMILGVVGGIVVVSWMPRRADDAGSARAPVGASADVEEDAATTVTDASGGPAADEFAALLPFPSEDERTAREERDMPPRARPGGRHSAVVVVAAVLAVGGGAVAPVSMVPGDVLAAADCWDPVPWIDLVTCDDVEPEPEPSASPSTVPSPGASEPAQPEEAEPETTEPETTEPDVTAPDVTEPAPSAGDGGAGSGATGGGEATGPAADGSGDPDAGEAGDGTGDTGEQAASGEGTQEDAKEVVTEAVEVELGSCVRVTFGGAYDLNVTLPGGCGVREDANVFSLDAELETRDLQLPLDGINGVSLVNVPVTNGGPRRDALKLSVDYVKVPGFWLKTYAHDGDRVAGTETRADYVSMEGDAQMYVSSIHANLPDGADLVEVAQKITQGASVVEILLGLVDARLGLLGATADTQVWSDFREQVWSED